MSSNKMPSAEEILNDKSRKASLEDVLGLTLEGQKLKATESVIPCEVPPPPVSAKGWQHRSAGPPTLADFQRRVGACEANRTFAYYNFADDHTDENPKVTRQGTRVLYGALNHWMSMIKREQPVDDFCVYNLRFRVCCTKKVFMTYFSKIAEECAETQAKKGGEVNTPEQILEELFESGISFGNFNNTHQAVYNEELEAHAKYKEEKDIAEATKPKKENSHTALSFDDIGELSKQITSHIRGGGAHQRKDRWPKAKVTLHDQIKMIRDDPQRRNAVIDVTGFGTKLGSVKGKISTLNAVGRNKHGVRLGEIPVVSQDLGSYERAMKYLGPEYCKYIDLARNAI